MKKRKKKSRNQDMTSKIILITAILNLIDKLTDLLQKLIEG